jgi:adenylate cyclase
MRHKKHGKLLFSSALGAPDDPRLSESLWEEFGCERFVLVMDMARFTTTSHEKGIVYYISLIAQMRQLTEPLVTDQGGQVVKYEGDNLFAVFPNPESAMTFLRAMYEETTTMNETRDRSAHLVLCEGIDHGMILLDDHDFFGDPVNLACKLGENLARHNEVLVSDRVHKQLGDYQFEEVGSHEFQGPFAPVFRWKID